MSTPNDTAPLQFDPSNTASDCSEDGGVAVSGLAGRYTPVSAPEQGRRFKHARTLSGMSLGDAAARLGFDGGADLHLLETGKQLPDLDLVIGASRLHGVSADFLCGLSDCPDADGETLEEHALARHFRKVMEDSVASTVATVRCTAADSPALAAHLAALRQQAGRVLRARLQHGDAVPASLVEAIDALIDQVDESHDYLRRRQMLKAYELMDDLDEVPQVEMRVRLRREVAAEMNLHQSPLTKV